MFFVAVGVIIGAPHIINGFNRVLEELVIPRMDLRNLQKRRAQQAKNGVPESDRETTHHVVLPRDMEFTTKELIELHDIGAIAIMERAAQRRPYIARAEAV